MREDRRPRCETRRCPRRRSPESRHPPCTRGCQCRSQKPDRVSRLRGAVRGERADEVQGRVAGPGCARGSLRAHVNAEELGGWQRHAHIGPIDVTSRVSLGVRVLLRLVGVRRDARVLRLSRVHVAISDISCDVSRGHGGVFGLDVSLRRAAVVVLAGQRRDAQNDAEEGEGERRCFHCVFTQFDFSDVDTSR